MSDRELVHERLSQILISHHYFDIDAEVVFSVCKERLPGLVRTVKAMLKDVESD